MSTLRKNVASQHIGFCLNKTTDGTAVTAGGAGNVVIDNGAQAACGGTFTHKGSGQWDYAPTQAETNGTSISFAFTGTSAIQVGMTFFTLNYDTTLSNVPGNVAQWLGVAAQADSNNLPKVTVGSGIKKNTALSGFTFVMTDSTTHNPKTGVTVTAQRSIDGAALGSCANSVAEISNGLYKIDLAAADLNGGIIDLRFTGTASDDLNIVLVTTP